MAIKRINAGAHVERHHVRVLRREIEPVAVDRNTARDAAAAALTQRFYRVKSL